MATRLWENRPQAAQLANLRACNLAGINRPRPWKAYTGDVGATSSRIEQETVRAVVYAYADGKIELEKPKTEGTGVKRLRIAPRFIPVIFKDIKNKPDPKVYNAESIARFLGWMSGKQVSPRVRNWPRLQKAP